MVFTLPQSIGSPEHPILLFGSDGMLGRAWVQLLESRGLVFEAPSLDEADFMEPDQAAATVQPRHGLVINCAAYTDVDRAESEPVIARRLNADAVGVIARSCKAAGIPLVHYSTDYVFNGRAGPPWKTSSPREPLNVYGESKAAGEEQIEQSGCPHLLVRTSWLYAPWGKNFVRTIAALQQQGRELKVVDDQTGRPTSAEHLAETTLKLIEKSARGIYHITDGGQCTWYIFARAIAEGLGLEPKVNPCTTAEYPRPARRPAWSVLDLEKTEHLLGPMPAWQTHLLNVLQRLEA